jgi:hypothetical protein
MSVKLFDPEISLIGNRQQIISFISCIDNIDYSSLDWSNPNRIEIAKYKTITKLEKENSSSSSLPNKKKSNSNINNKINNINNDLNAFEKGFDVTLHLYVSGNNYLSFYKRNAMNSCIDLDRSDNIIYFFDGIADKKNFKKFSLMLETDIMHIHNYEGNIKDKMKTIFILGNRLDDKKNSITIKEINQLLEINNKYGKLSKILNIKFLKLDFPYLNNDEDDEFESKINYKSSYNKENIARLMNEITRLSLKNHLEKLVAKSIKINITGDMDSLHIFLSKYFNDSANEKKYHIKNLVNTGAERRTKITFFNNDPIKLYLNGIRIEYININIFGENYSSDVVIFLVIVDKYKDTLNYLINFSNEYIKEMKGNNEKLKEKIKNLKFYIFFDKENKNVIESFSEIFKTKMLNGNSIPHEYKYIDFDNVGSLIRAIEDIIKSGY